MDTLDYCDTLVLTIVTIWCYIDWPYSGYGDMGVHIRPFTNDALGAGAVTKLLQQDVSYDA